MESHHWSVQRKNDERLWLRESYQGDNILLIGSGQKWRWFLVRCVRNCRQKHESRDAWLVLENELALVNGQKCRVCSTIDNGVFDGKNNTTSNIGPWKSIDITKRKRARFFCSQSCLVLSCLVIKWWSPLEHHRSLNPQTSQEVPIGWNSINNPKLLWTRAH